MTGYERTTEYFMDETRSIVNMVLDAHEPIDDELYESGNYYSNRELAINNSRADELLRKLRRFVAENNDSKIDWTDSEQEKWVITYDYSINDIVILSGHFSKHFGQITFTSEEIAERAVKMFKKELMWYFTEYVDTLEELKDEDLCDCESDEILLEMLNCNYAFCPMCGRKLENNI